MVGFRLTRDELVKNWQNKIHILQADLMDLKSGNTSFDIPPMITNTKDIQKYEKRCIDLQITHTEKQIQEFEFLINHLDGESVLLGLEDLERLGFYSSLHPSLSYMPSPRVFMDNGLDDETH